MGRCQCQFQFQCAQANMPKGHVPVAVQQCWTTGDNRCALAAGEKLGHMAALRVMRHDATDNAALLWHPTTNAVCLGSISGVISMEDLNQDARDKRSVNLFLQWRCSQPVDTSLAEETLNQRSVMTTLRHARCHYAERTQACT